jgi:hypothetical protein
MAEEEAGGQSGLILDRRASGRKSASHFSWPSLRQPAPYLGHAAGVWLAAPMTDRRSLLIAAAGLALPAAKTKDAIGYSRPALDVIAAARKATGGPGWDLLRGWHEMGRENGQAYQAWLDPVRYGLRVELHEADGVRTFGFNGGGAWEISAAGQVTGTADPLQVGRARTEAFFRTMGWLWPGRFDAHGALVGLRRAEGRSFQVLEVQPYAGELRELWFDAQTHRLDRIVDRRVPAAPVRFSDYCKAGPVWVPFHTEAPGADRQVETVAFAPADRTLFSLPRSMAGLKG